MKNRTARKVKNMKVVDAVAKVLKAEGVEYLFAYPVNPIIEAAAKLDIRPIIVRQERIGLHMADAMSRITSGEKIGVFCMQSGPGSENAFGGVAQAYGDSAPIVVLPGGYSRSVTQIQPNFNSALNYRHVTKSCEQVTMPEAVPEAMRRAFTQVRNGRPRPALVEFPSDLFGEEISDSFDPTPVPTVRYGPDSAAIEAAAAALLDAECPVIYAGQGVHYAQAWDSLKELAELLGSPVTTSLGGKSAFPEDHPLALGSGGRAIPKPVHHFLQKTDLILGIGCSFTRTGFGVRIPEGKRVIHATLDPADINKDVPVETALVGDAGLILEGLVAAVRDRSNGASEEQTAAVTGEISAVKAEWLDQWKAKLTSDEVPMTPYRVISDLLHTVDVENTIITHDAGSPRDQMSPFWQSVAPLTYIGWGKTTQLGYGLGLAMGAKLARPDALCVNVWGDAAIGFTGMDFETAVRERIPILSVLFNNFSMAIEIPIMPVSTEKFRSTDISGHYADMAKAFGGYGERVETPDQIIPAIQRGIQKTQEGVPALLEFITAKEIQISSF
ncbi:MAG: thiamine pyrophosphate-requiring protein [Candidatus Poribacteria bacterium]|nr:thiamine pyrophosphate-requiring protein [Candidatus Poribacteria bacterium]